MLRTFFVNFDALEWVPEKYIYKSIVSFLSVNSVAAADAGCEYTSRMCISLLSGSSDISHPWYTLAVT